MKRVLIALVLVGVAANAFAQATASRPAASASGDPKWSAAVQVGGTFGNQTSAAFGGEVSYALTDNIEVFVEGGRMTNVTNDAMKQAATVVDTYLNTLGKGTASHSMTAPANYGGVGVRYVIMKGSFQPYVAGSVGMANLELKPTFILNGVDITSTIGNYGVWLGKDVDGKYNKVMFTGGLGVQWKATDKIFVDLGVRGGRINAEINPVTVVRGYLGVGYRF